MEFDRNEIITILSALKFTLSCLKSDNSIKESVEEFKLRLLIEKLSTRGKNGK